MGSVQVKKAQGRDGQHVLKRSEGMWKKGVEEGELFRVGLLLLQ